MASLNRVLLMGNLTRDPELRYTGGGTAVAQLGLAVNRRYRNRDDQWQDEVTFVDIDVYGRQAETANEYLRKGRGVFIEGRLQLDQWEDKETGRKRSRLKVVAERWQFVGGRGGESDDPDGERPEPSRSRSSQGRRSPPARDEAPPKSGDEEPFEIPEDDVPF